MKTHVGTAYETLDAYCDLPTKRTKSVISKYASTISKDEVAERLTDMGNRTRTDNDTAKYDRHDADNNAHKRTARTSNKSRMLSNPEISRWHANMARGSAITADITLRRLDVFCRTHQMSPMELASLGMKDVRTATNLLEDHITWMEDKKYAPSYVNSYVKAVKSWLAHFDVEIRRRVKVRNMNQTPTLQDERVPDAGEIAEVFARVPLRTAAMISLMSKSGVRPEVMGNHDGTDGLRMHDLPDVVIHQGVTKCIKTPCQIIVRSELSKTRHQYFTFLTASGTTKLLAYLNDRLACGEPLHGGSAVIAPDHKYPQNRTRRALRTFVSTPQISKEIRKTFRPRFQWRPYILRAYFDTQLLIAESKGRIAHDFRVFFMGHKGSMEARYTTNKGMLPEMLTREMRESFARSEEFLDLEDRMTHEKHDVMQGHKQELQDAIQSATPEQLDLMLEALRKGAGNIQGLACHQGSGKRLQTPMPQSA